MDSNLHLVATYDIQMTCHYDGMITATRTLKRYVHDLEDVSYFQFQDTDTPSRSNYKGRFSKLTNSTNVDVQLIGQYTDILFDTGSDYCVYKLYRLPDCDALFKIEERSYTYGGVSTATIDFVEILPKI
jgi:hypothetical protein